MSIPDWFGSLPWLGTLPPPDNMFWAAALLVAGALAGEIIARTTRLPRVVGYTLAGFAAAGAGWGSTLPLPGPQRVIVDIALALLLFEIGSRVHLRWLRFNPALLWTSLAEAVCGAAAVLAVLSWLEQDLRVALACAALSMPASAAVAGRVALELGGEGQVTDRMTMLVALNTLYAVLVLTLLTGWWHAASPGSAVDALLGLAQRSSPRLGSLLLAALLAAAVAAVARRLDLRNESAVLLVLGLMVLAISAARTAGLSTLLVPLLAGLLLRNTTERPGSGRATSAPPAACWC